MPGIRRTKRQRSRRTKRQRRGRTKRQKRGRTKRQIRGSQRGGRTSMENNEEFQLFEYLMNVDLNNNKIKEYLNKKIKNKQHPLFKLKEFIMTSKKDTQVYLDECIKLFIESQHTFLNSFDIEKCFKKDEKTIQKITDAIKQCFQTFTPGRTNMSGGNKETCVICLESIDNSSDNNDSTSQKLFGDDCTHYPNFHKDCINDWVMTAEQTGQRAACPLCKREIQDDFRNMIDQEQIQGDLQRQQQEETNRRNRRVDVVVRNERRRLRREGVDYLLCSLLCFIFIRSQIQQMSDRPGGFNLGTIPEQQELLQAREREHNRFIEEIDQQLEQEARMNIVDITLSRLSGFANPNIMPMYFSMLMLFYGVMRLIRMPMLGIVDIYRSYTLTFDWEDREMLNQYNNLVNQEERQQQELLQAQANMFFDNE